MGDSFSTSLHALIKRSMSGMIDDIAKDGLMALKQTLDEAGVSKSLKSLEMYSHVSKDSIIFEIIVDSSEVVSSDKKAISAIQEESRAEMMKEVLKTFSVGSDGPTRLVYDARSPKTGSSDSTGTKDEPKRLNNPRGMSLTQDGKLSVTLERSVTDTMSGIMIPKDQYQGILNEFIGNLSDVIKSSFSIRFEKILMERFK